MVHIYGILLGYTFRIHFYGTLLRYTFRVHFYGTLLGYTFRVHFIFERLQLPRYGGLVNEEIEIGLELIRL